MRTMLLLVALAVVIPGQAHAAGGSLGGHLESASPVHLAGAATFSAASGVLDLTPVARAAAMLNVSWSAAEGRHVVANWSSVVVTDGAGWRGQQPSTTSTPLAWSAGRIDRILCFSQCVVALFAEGKDATLSLGGNAEGDLGWATSPMRYCAIACEAHENTFGREMPEGSVVVSGASAGMTDGIVSEASAAARGEVLLFVKDARVWYADASGAHDVETRIGDEPLVPLPLGGSVSNHTNGFIELHLHGAVLDVPNAAGVVLSAEETTVDLVGTARFARASGEIEFQGERIRVSDEDVRIRGAPRIVAATLDPVLPALTARHSTEGLGGSASEIGVGASVAREAGIPSPIVGARIAGAALALALLARLVWAPLYSRISRSRVLANENRRRVHEAIARQPGLTVAEVAREIGLARIVVKHHVQMLEAHSMLVARRLGRKRRLFAPEAAPSPDDALAHEMLQNATRTRIMIALRDAPRPLTQRDLTDLTGVGQRMVSHHLARLERVGLVRSTTGMPRTYTVGRS